MPNSLMDQAQFKRTLSHAMLWPLLLMAALVALALWQVGRLLAATRWIDHTDQVIALVRLTQKQVTDMQAGLRGYSLTHDPQFLQRYTRAHAAFHEDANAVQHLTADNAHQQQRLTHLLADYARWFDMLNHNKAIPARTYLVRSKPSLDALNTDFQRFVATEDALRKVRIQAAQHGAGRTLGVGLGCAGLVGLFLACTHRRQLLRLSHSYQRQCEAMRASAEELGITLQSIGDAVIATDAQGRVTLLNPVAQRLTGWTHSEAQGKEVQEVFCIVEESTRHALECPVAKVLQEGRVVGLANHTLLLGRHGAQIPIEDTAAPIRDAHGELRGVVLVFHDVSERRRLQSQLLQSQKLESVGRLSGGIAHDFNNLLTVILGNAEMAQEECGLQAPLEEYLAFITEAAQKAAELTRQLLAFARRQVIEPRLVNLNDLILSLEKMLGRLITENIELVVVAAAELHTVKVDPTQFEQILVNLVVNARDAMPQGGKICVETHNTLLDEDYVRHHEEVSAGEYVMLSVSDTGSGMDEAVRLHIFEPFFTTKEKGRGTGLGLATVYGIVKQAGGHIWLYSEAGAGTTFKIYLPRTTASEEASPIASEKLEVSGGSETILLVEDEPNVRMLGVEALQRRGYRVLEAMNGEEALRLVSGCEREVALLITDVVMPQMSGKELADRLQALHPALKVLYASGYTENAIVHHGVLDAGIAFLQKPYTPSVLARKVREVLDSI